MKPIAAMLFAVLLSCGGQMGAQGPAGATGQQGQEGPAGTALVRIHVSSANDFQSSLFLACPIDTHVVGGGCTCSSTAGTDAHLVSAKMVRFAPEGYQCDCAPLSAGETPIVGVQVTCIGGTSVQFDF